jgi:hypothetical protein
VKEMENFKPGSCAMTRETSVDFPDPDGAEIMKTVVIPD